ncbi:MAG: glutamine synthetase family protein [Candidatus Odinarchaeota archaeon]
MAPEERDPEFIRLLFTDLLGSTRSIEVGYDRLEEVMESGIVIDGSSIPGYSSINDSDALILPTRATPITQPWDKSAAFMLCGVHDVSGSPHPRDPRNILKRIVAFASEQGFKLLVGSELEFFTITRSIDNNVKPCDHGGYFSSIPLDSSLELRREIIRALNAIGIPTTSHHHEVAQGQQEIGLRYLPAETAADNIMMARLIISEIAYRRGLIATFMPKPFVNQNGSGMHLHQSVWSVNESKNLFAGERCGEISTLATNYIGGLLEHATTLAAVLAPTVNSYKRLVPGFEAPTAIAWGYRNRSTMIRVPHFNGSHDAARIELRCPDASSSPHLGIAAMLSAGLDGIQRKIEPPLPSDSNLYESKKSIKCLPVSLQSAISYLEKSKMLRNRLGNSTIDFLVAKRRQEWTDYVQSTEDPGSSEITSWEIEKYLLAN